MSADEVAPEPDGVQDFILSRQSGVLERAIATLRDCPPQELAAQSHRLAGTLGTYQLMDASLAVRAIYDQARADGAEPERIDREPALDALSRTLVAITPGEGSR